MLSKILGSIWIITGLLWTIKPVMLKNRLNKKMSRKLRLVVYVFIAVFGLFIIGSALKARGLLPKIAGLLGIIITIKAILLLTSKSSEKMLAWWSGRPVVFFRALGAFMFLMGLGLFFSRG